MKSFQETTLWKDSIYLYRDTVKLIYRLKEKRFYRLSEQLESSCGSISDNIAEGFGRGGNKELIQFLMIANGSCSEFRSQIIRIEILGMLTTNELNHFEQRAEGVSKQISAFIKYLKNSDLKGRKFN